METSKHRYKSLVTVEILRVLARGATMLELCNALNLGERSVRGYLTSLEALGIDLERPPAGGGKVGEYRLKDPNQVLFPKAAEEAPKASKAKGAPKASKAKEAKGGRARG